jgi:hypothetical protein
MQTITKAAADSMLPPAKGQTFLRDDKLRGFALRVTAAGIKSFVFEGRVRGRVRRITIGQYPRLASVSHARKRCASSRPSRRAAIRSWNVPPNGKC